MIPASRLDMANVYDIPRDKLFALYVEEEKSIKEISYLFNCSARTIHRRLRQFNIKTRKPWDHKYIPVDIDKIKKKYLVEKKSIKEIADELGLSYSKVRSEMINKGIVRRDRLELSLNNPNLEASKNLCYILGVLRGDGYLYRNGSNYCLALEAVDMPFIKSFSESLENIGLTVSGPYSRKRAKKHCTIHKVEARSKLFFNWFSKLDIEDISAIIIKADGKLGFLKGIYESEGSYFITGNRKTLTIASTDKKLMLLIKDIVNELNFTPTFPKPQILKSGKEYYKLYFNKQKEIKKFIRMVEPCIKEEPVNGGKKE